MEFDREPYKIESITVTWRISTQIAFIWPHWFWCHRGHKCGLWFPSSKFSPTLTEICTNCVSELCHSLPNEHICIAQSIGYPSQIRLTTTDHIHIWLRFMFLRIVIWGTGLPESYYIWSNSCRQSMQYSHISKMYRTFMVTQVYESSQVWGHVNWTVQLSVWYHCAIWISLHCV